MNINNIEEYVNTIDKYSIYDINWNYLKNKAFLITGATGMIGKCLIDILMNKNKKEDLNCTIIAVGRNKEKARERLGMYFDNKNFVFVESDINKSINVELDNIDYILHAASSTHPLQYSSDPIGTITANVIGLYNLLELAKEKNNKKFVFASSVEIYGENRRDVEKFDENYLGYIDCNTLRAGYPESKRVGEALCQAYIKQEKLDIVIARLSRIYGPTMLESDSKASSQFIKNSVNDEDIVLKSEGLQYYSYSYVFDAVIGVLTCLINGLSGEAYNISDEKFDITLKDFAQNCADLVNKKVIFNLPSKEEQAGFSKATKAILDSKKISKIGYHTDSTLKQTIEDTIKILKKAKN